MVPTPRQPATCVHTIAQPRAPGAPAGGAPRVSFQSVLSRPASTVRLRFPRVRLGVGSVMCTLVLALVALLVVYPVVLLVAHSFEVGVFGRETRFGFDNWVRALTEPQLVNAIWNTV